MIAAGGLNALRLLDAEGAPARPSGMVVPREAVAGLAARLARRAKHYSTLRVTALPDALVFWSVADEVTLPWSDDDPLYLTHAGKAVFFPAGKRIGLPGKWAEGVIDRLAAAKGLSRPILLLSTQRSLQHSTSTAEKPSPHREPLWRTTSVPHGRGLSAADIEVLVSVPATEDDGLRAIGLGRNSAPVVAVDWMELARS